MLSQNKITADVLTEGTGKYMPARDLTFHRTGHIGLQKLVLLFKMLLTSPSPPSHNFIMKDSQKYKGWGTAETSRVSFSLTSLGGKVERQVTTVLTLKMVKIPTWILALSLFNSLAAAEAYKKNHCTKPDCFYSYPKKLNYWNQTLTVAV